MNRQKIVPKGKMQKALRKELDAKKRGSWGAISPVTRAAKNKKAYDRKMKWDVPFIKGSFAPKCCPL